MKGFLVISRAVVTVLLILLTIRIIFGGYEPPWWIMGLVFIGITLTAISDTLEALAEWMEARHEVSH